MINQRCKHMILGLAFGFSLALAVQSDGRAHADDTKTKGANIEGDLKKIQGEWVSKDDMGESSWIFKDDRVSIKAPGRSYEITIKLDSKAEPEKHMDFTVLEDSPNASGSKALGIYKLTDDGKLLICFGGPDASRPKEFKTDFGTAFSFELKKKDAK